MSEPSHLKHLWKALMRFFYRLCINAAEERTVTPRTPSVVTLPLSLRQLCPSFQRLLPILFPPYFPISFLPLGPLRFGEGSRRHGADVPSELKTCLGDEGLTQLEGIVGSESSEIEDGRNVKYEWVDRPVLLSAVGRRFSHH